MLELKNISSGYGKKQVLHSLSFDLKDGEMVLLTGGNGSGKSTILKCIYNILPLWEGEVFFNGEKISGSKPNSIIRKGIVYIPQKNNYFENLTIQENLEVSGTIYGKDITSERIKRVYEEFPWLKNFKNRTPFGLSGGERQLLAFGMAVVHEPKIILFDEPLAGLDKKNSQKIKNKIVELNDKSNIGFLIVEHSKNISDIFDRVIKISMGRLN